MHYNIFGGSGFIGSHFYLQSPYESTVVPRNVNTPSIPKSDIIYFISTTHNYNIYSDPHLDINTNLTKLVDVLHALGPGPEVFNYISTWFVYGTRHGMHNAVETDAPNPNGFYSITKLCAEQLVASYCQTIGRPYRILRLCNVVGNDPNASARKNAIEFMISQLQNNLPIRLYRENHARNFMHVSDVCRAIRLICDQGEINTVYNVGNKCGSLRIHDIINKISRDSTLINIIDSPLFHKNIQGGDFYMNVDKLTAIGFTPIIDVFDFLTNKPNN